MYSIIDVNARKYFAFLLIYGKKVILFSRLDVPIASPSKVASDHVTLHAQSMYVMTVRVDHFPRQIGLLMFCSHLVDSSHSAIASTS